MIESIDYITSQINNLLSKVNDLLLFRRILFSYVHCRGFAFKEIGKFYIIP